MLFGRRWVPALTPLVFMVALNAGLGRAAVVFSNGTFAPGTWTAPQKVGNGSVSSSQVVAGGNPGEYLRVDHLNFSYVPIVFHYPTGATYSPSVQGAIDTASWSINKIAILNFDPYGVAVAGALLQNGQTCFPTLQLDSDISWVTLSGTSLTAADFSTRDNASAHPDFSATGSQIQIGFVTANDNTNRTASRAAGFDNWPVTVNQSETSPVPEPSALLLPGSGLAGIIETGAQAGSRAW